jgi:hypothetical protein
LSCFLGTCGIDCTRDKRHFDWKYLGKGNVQLADRCDFSGNDLYQKESSGGEECGQFCIEEARCTHFTYSISYGNEVQWKSLNVIAVNVISFLK